MIIKLSSLIKNEKNNLSKKKFTQINYNSKID